MSHLRFGFDVRVANFLTRKTRGTLQRCARGENKSIEVQHFYNVKVNATYILRCSFTVDSFAKFSVVANFMLEIYNFLSRDCRLKIFGEIGFLLSTICILENFLAYWQYFRALEDRSLYAFLIFGFITSLAWNFSTFSSRKKRSLVFSPTRGILWYIDYFTRIQSTISAMSWYFSRIFGIKLFIYGVSISSSERRIFDEWKRERNKCLIKVLTKIWLFLFIFKRRISREIR